MNAAVTRQAGNTTQDTTKGQWPCGPAAITSHARLSEELQWSAVRVTAVTVTVGYSDSFGNPRFITNKTPLLTVPKIGYSDTT